MTGGRDTDSSGHRITLQPITDENWRAVADVVPRDDQRTHVPPSAARYLLLSAREGVWRSLAVQADDEIVGHVMWGFDEDDQCHWIGGLMIDAGRQGCGVGRAAMVMLLRRLFDLPDCRAVRLSYPPSNAAARALYAGLGFREIGIDDDGDEMVAELTAP